MHRAVSPTHISFQSSLLCNPYLLFSSSCVSFLWIVSPCIYQKSDIVVISETYTWFIKIWNKFFPLRWNNFVREQRETSRFLFTYWSVTDWRSFQNMSSFPNCCLYGAAAECRPGLGCLTRYRSCWFRGLTSKWSTGVMKTLKGKLESMDDTRLL